MSLILDALKKSEQERRRERGPDLQSIHQPAAAPSTEKSRAPWLVAALVVVVLNGAALAWWWRAEPAATAAGEAVTSDEAAVATTEPPTQVANTAAPPAAAAPAAPAPLPTQPPPQEPPLQELWELPEPVRRQLPAMTYSFHVYSGDPSRRTIIINNQRMREGSEIQPGLMLESITETGVVLALGGHRVHIPVLESW